MVKLRCFAVFKGTAWLQDQLPKVIYYPHSSVSGANSTLFNQISRSRQICAHCPKWDTLSQLLGGGKNSFILARRRPPQKNSHYKARVLDCFLSKIFTWFFAIIFKERFGERCARAKKSADGNSWRRQESIWFGHKKRRMRDKPKEAQSITIQFSSIWPMLQLILMTNSAYEIFYVGLGLRNIASSFNWMSNFMSNQFRFLEGIFYDMNQLNHQAIWDQIWEAIGMMGKVQVWIHHRIFSLSLQDRQV